MASINFDSATNGLAYGSTTGYGTNYYNTSTNLFNTKSLAGLNEYNQTIKGYNISNQANDLAVETEIQNICSYIANGKEDNALDAYEELLNEMSTYSIYATLIDSETGDDTKLRSYLRSKFEDELGSDLEDYIRDNTRNSVEVEKQKCYRGEFCDSTTTEDLLKAICNVQEDEGHLSEVGKSWHEFWGGIAKVWNSVFGDGKKH